MLERLLLNRKRENQVIKIINLMKIISRNYFYFIKKNKKMISMSLLKRLFKNFELFKKI